MRRSANEGWSFLVVEGTSDKRALAPLLGDRFYYIPARGKDMVLHAQERLTAEGVNDCLFLVDCDGEVDPQRLGMSNLIVSSNRDLEADLLFELKAFDRIALEYLSDFGYGSSECERVGRELLAFVSGITARLGIGLDAARQLGLPVKILDQEQNRRRRVSLLDVPEMLSWVNNFVPVDSLDVAEAVARLLSWGEGELQSVAQIAERGASKLCRLHGLAACPSCTPRRYSNGRDLIAGLSLALSQRCGFKVTEAELSRSLRLATSPLSASNWSVALRVDAWWVGRSVA
jgi:hypothetical protein